MPEPTDKPIVTPGHIGEFRPDPNNARRHTPRNVGMIEQSLNELGAGRSILASRDGTILAGNATMDAAASAGIEDALVVHTDGTRLVVVVRDDLDASDPRAVKLALVDNRAAELAEWDTDVLSGLVESFADDPSFDRYFSADDLARLLDDVPTRGGDEPEDDAEETATYTVVVECADEDDAAAFIEELEAAGRTYKAKVS